MSLVYKIQHDTTPDTYVFTQFSVSDTSSGIRLQDDEIYGRYELSGGIKFYGDDFDYINNYRAINPIMEVSFYINGTLQANGKFNLELNSDYDYDSKVVTLDFITVDQYTTFLENLSNVKNIVLSPTSNVFVDVVGGSEKKYTRYSNFFNVIELVIKNSDSEITFDYTPVGSGISSFYPFWNKDKYENLFVTAITNAILNDSGEERSDGAAIANMETEKLLDFIKQRFGIYYEIDSNKVMYFRAKVDVYSLSSSSLPAHDQTTYKNINWSNKNNIERLESDKAFNLLKRNEVGSNDDFIGLDITYPNITETNTKEISNSLMYVDIDDIINRPSAYPDDSNEAFSLITCDDYVVDVADKFTNDPAVGIDSVNGVPVAGGEEFNNVTPLSTVSTTIGRFMSSTFSSLIGEDITISFTIDDYTNVKLLLMIGQSVIVETYNLVSNTVNHVFTPTSSNSNYNIGFEVNGSLTRVFSNISIIPKSYKVRRANGAVSGDLLNNVELSVANTDEDDYLTDQADKVAVINDTQRTLNDNQVIIKATQQEFQSVSTDIVNDFDINQYVKTSLDDEMRADSFTQANNGSGIVTLKLKR